MVLPNLASFIYRVQQDSGLSYVEPATTQVGGTFSSVLTLAISAVNQLISIASLFPALTNAYAISLYDITLPLASGFSFALATTDTPMLVRPGGVWSWASTGLPSFYLNNPSSTSAIQVELWVSGQ